MASATAQLLESIRDRNSGIEFKAIFTGNHHDTLAYIFEIRKFNLVNPVSDERFKFSRIFNTIPSQFQNRFMRINTNNLTVDALEKWLIDRFTPPQTKHDFIIKLKLIRMRRNENPLLVYERYNAKLHHINAAIKLLNSRDGATKIAPISGEVKVEILRHIFVRMNNKSNNKLDNNGPINDLTVKYIARVNPKKIANWIQMFKDMKQELIPDVLSDLFEYQYTDYYPRKHDDDIYFNQNDIIRHDPDEYDESLARNERTQCKYNKYDDDSRRGGKSRRGRKRGHTDAPYNNNDRGRGGYRNNNDRGRGGYRRGNKRRGFFSNDGPRNKRHRSDDRNPSINLLCKRCHRTNHEIEDCRARYDVDGTKLGSCRRCGRMGHYEAQCYSKYDVNDEWIGNDNTDDHTSEHRQKPTSSTPEINTFTKKKATDAVTQTFNAMTKAVMENTNLTVEEQHSKCVMILAMQEQCTENLQRL